MNKSKIIKITAYALAGVVLGGALAYFNFVEKEPEGLARVGDICPQFTVGGVYETDGEQFSIDEDANFSVANYTGKTLVLNFWAPWCEPCRKEMTHFNTLQQNYADEVAVVIVNNGGESPEELLNGYFNNPVETYYAEFYSQWPTYACTFVCPKEGDDILSLFEINVPTLPVTIIINEKGIIKEILTKPYHEYTELESDVLSHI